MCNCYLIRCCNFGGQKTYGNAIYSSVSENENSLNNMNMTSFCRCTHKLKYGCGICNVYYGTQQLSAINFSLNHCSYFPSLYICHPYEHGCVRFITAENCTTYDWSLFKVTSSFYDLEYSSFIKNTAPSQYGLFVSDNSILNIQFCIIRENSKIKCFYLVNEGSFNIDNSYIDNYNQDPYVNIDNMNENLIINNTFINFPSLYRNILHHEYSMFFTINSSCNKKQFDIQLSITYIFILIIQS